MIYPITSIKYRVLSIKGQQGVTLLLSILVLSAIMAIALSLATILLVEVRVAGDLLRTEPAFYASNAVTEEALFTVRRGYPRCQGLCANQFYYTTQLGAVSLNNPQPTENLFHDANFQDKVLAISNSILNSKNRYALYNPTDINQPGGYAQLKVTFKDTGAGGRIHVYICEFKAPKDFLTTDPPLDCKNPNSTDMIYQDTSPLNQAQATPLILLAATKQQELIIYAEPSGLTPTADRFVQVQAFDSAGQPKGIPYYGETVVDINAQFGGVTRAERVKIPLSGVSSVSGPVGNSASFVSTDTTTRGSWHGVYGADGYNVIGGTQSYPGYVTVTPGNNLFYSWADPTGDNRGLYKSAASSSRLADTWYNSSQWTLDFNFNDANTHQTAIYMLDWDGDSGRSQIVDVLDGATSTVLDTRNVANFSNGQYWIWNLRGHVIFRFTQTGIWNSVVSGIFFR